jgi:hypothetical protein
MEVSSLIPASAWGTQTASSVEAPPADASSAKASATHAASTTETATHATTSHATTTHTTTSSGLCCMENSKAYLLYTTTGTLLYGNGWREKSYK